MSNSFPLRWTGKRQCWGLSSETSMSSPAALVVCHLRGQTSLKTVDLLCLYQGKMICFTILNMFKDMGDVITSSILTVLEKHILLICLSGIMTTLPQKSIGECNVISACYWEMSRTSEMIWMKDDEIWGHGSKRYWLVVTIIGQEMLLFFHYIL